MGKYFHVFSTNLVWRILCRVLKISFIVSTILLFCVGSFYQIKAEKYIKQSREKYGVYTEKRKSYLPFIFFYFNYRNKGGCFDYLALSDIPYKNQGLEDGYIYNQMFASYGAFCFYTKKELIAP
jgi:hypothetical protein